MIGKITVGEVKQSEIIIDEKDYFVITKYLKDEEITMFYNPVKKTYQLFMSEDCKFVSLNEAIAKRNVNCKPFETADHSVIIKKFDVNKGELINATR